MRPCESRGLLRLRSAPALRTRRALTQTRAAVPTFHAVHAPILRAASSPESHGFWSLPTCKEYGREQSCIDYEARPQRQVWQQHGASAVRGWVSYDPSAPPLGFCGQCRSAVDFFDIAPTPKAQHGESRSEFSYVKLSEPDRALYLRSPEQYLTETEFDQAHFVRMTRPAGRNFRGPGDRAETDGVVECRTIGTATPEPRNADVHQHACKETHGKDNYPPPR